MSATVTTGRRKRIAATINTFLASQIVTPVLLGAIFIAVWEILVLWLEVPSYVLPAPSSIIRALLQDFPTLMQSTWVTLRIAAAAFSAALALAVGLAILFAQSKTLENSLFPYAVVLQVTPVISIAPLIMIWIGLDRVELALFVMATIVAFFPILSNTTLGLKSVDHNLLSLFDLYHASRWQKLRELQFPAALPYMMAGTKIAGGLALIGAVVAEFVAGAGAGSGLAWRVLESGNRLDIPRMFAALFLLSVLGIAIFSGLSAVECLLLHRWHDSVREREI